MGKIHVTLIKDKVVVKEVDEDPENVPWSWREVTTAGGVVPVARIEDEIYGDGERIFGGRTTLFDAGGNVLNVIFMEAEPPPPPPPEADQEREARLELERKRRHELDNMNAKQAVKEVRQVIFSNPLLIFWAILMLLALGMVVWLIISLLLPKWWQ